MDEHFSNLPGYGDNIAVYLDDIGIGTKTFKEHLSAFEVIFRKCRLVGAKLHIKKCEFAQQAITYLGHTITAGGLRPLEKNVVAIRDYPRPKDVHQIRIFLGMCSYYRHFIKSFAKIATALVVYLRGNPTKYQKINWNARAQTAMDRLKHKLMTEPVLIPPDFAPDKPWVIETDGSTTGLGAVLQQEGADGKLHPIAYASRALRSAELSYGVTDLELLGIVYALKCFDAYIRGST